MSQQASRLIGIAIIAAPFATTSAATMFTAQSIASADGEVQYHVPDGTGPVAEGTDGGGTVDATTAANLRVGTSSGGDSVFNAIFVFQLSPLPAGETIVTDANLRFRFADQFGGIIDPASADLYGLGFRTSSSLQPGDFFFGNEGTDATDATLIQNDILTGTITDGTFIETSADGDAALNSYLQAQYVAAQSAFANNQDVFVFLRLNPDDARTGGGGSGFTGGSQVNAEEAGVFQGTDRGPTLTYQTTVPEPSALAAVLLGAAVVRRRRQCC
jgi:hypothetical protein